MNEGRGGESGRRQASKMKFRFLNNVEQFHVPLPYIILK
jgi:hypothetical protein